MCNVLRDWNFTVCKGPTEINHFSKSCILPAMVDRLQKCLRYTKRLKAYLSEIMEF